MIHDIKRSLAVIMLFSLILIGFNAHPAYAAGVVGNGTAGSCTLSALQAALGGGGTITFNCGSSPVTIHVTSTLTISTPTLIDGGGLIMLDGGNTTRVIANNSALTVQNLTIAHGHATGSNALGNGGGIEGGWQANLTVINCTFSNNISNPSVTTTNAYDYGGGAIFSIGGTLLVSGSAFNNNGVINGGGGAIHGLRSDLDIRNSTFTNNTLSGSGNGAGGALYADGALNDNNGKIRITDSTFTNNVSQDFGGALHIHMYLAGDSTVIDRSTFSGNSSTGMGGAMYFGNGIITITNSLFTNNTANSVGNGSSGGAIGIAEPSVITIANSTITGNRALGPSYNANGGGLYVVNNTQPFTIINSTIAANYAGWVGGGITGKPGILKNTIVAGNSAGNGSNTWQILQQCSDKLTDGGNNLQWPPKNPNPNYYNETVCADNITVADPKLYTLSSNGGPTQTLPLLSGSPAINAGNDAVCASAPISNADQRGFTRITSGNPTCDIGAYEAVPGQALTNADTIGIFRQGTYYLRNSNTTGNADLSFPFSSASNLIPVVGDWIGNGIDTVGVYDWTAANFYLRDSNTSGSFDQSFTLGSFGDNPLSGRWSGVATHDGAGVFRPSNGVIYLKNELTTGFADFSMILGLPGDKGIAGDWNGDHLDSPGVFRPSTINFYLSNQITNGAVYADIALTYGSASDIPIAGDWTAQGHDTIGMFRPSNGFVYLRNELTTGFADNAFFYGTAGDQPVAGHWQSNAPTPPHTPGVPAPVLIPPKAPNPSGESVPGDGQIGG